MIKEGKSPYIFALAVSKTNSKVKILHTAHLHKNRELARRRIICLLPTLTHRLCLDTTRTVQVRPEAVRASSARLLTPRPSERPRERPPIAALAMHFHLCSDRSCEFRGRRFTISAGQVALR